MTRTRYTVFCSGFLQGRGFLTDGVGLGTTESWSSVSPEDSDCKSVTDGRGTSDGTTPVTSMFSVIWTITENIGGEGLGLWEIFMFVLRVPVHRTWFRLSTSLRCGVCRNPLETRFVYLFGLLRHLHPGKLGIVTVLATQSLDILLLQTVILSYRCFRKVRRATLCSRYNGGEIRPTIH